MLHYVQHDSVFLAAFAFLRVCLGQAFGDVLRFFAALPRWVFMVSVLELRCAR
jgi:hypothetical protein